MISEKNYSRLAGLDNLIDAANNDFSLDYNLKVDRRAVISKGFLDVSCDLIFTSCDALGL